MGMSAGRPLGEPARWVETRKDGVWLGKVRDFAGHEAAAFGLRDTGKVLYLDLEVEKPSGRDQFVPAPKVAPFDVPAAPGTAGKIHYFAIQPDKEPPMALFAGRRGTYLGFEPSDSREPIRLGLDALALLAAGGNAAAVQNYRKALRAASPDELFETVRALLWSRQRDLLKESIEARPSLLGEDEHPAWQGRFFAGGLEAIAKLKAPEGLDDLATLARAAREWTQRPTPQAAAVALAAGLGTEFRGWQFAPPRRSTPQMEGFVEARYGPFQSDSIYWWELVSEIEPKFAKDVMSQLQDAAGETGVWIESADPRGGRIVTVDEQEWTLGPGVAIPDGIGFGSRVSVISRQETILALKLERHEPKVLALQRLKEAKSRDVGVLARERAAGRPGLTSKWAKYVDSLQDFSPLEALQVSCDPEFLGELEALLPRALKEARYRHDTSSIQLPIVVALGWIAVKSYDRARALLDRTPELIRSHGVPYGSDGKLSSYQESLIVHARWLADRREKPEATLPEEPEYAGSDIHDWIKSLGIR